MNHPIRWLALITAYPTQRKRAVKFDSKDDIRKAVKLCWNDPDFEGMPYGIADGLTLVVPEEAVGLFDKKGLHVKTRPLKNQGDLSPNKHAKLREKYGM